MCTGDKFLTQVDQGANKERCSVGPHARFQENRLWHLQESASKYPRGYFVGLVPRGYQSLVVYPGIDTRANTVHLFSNDLEDGQTLSPASLQVTKRG